ncbi:licABCH operon regulator [Liquorilactobacillus aquaticus DSM 21051]|uniref:LicABCH operon regulator n=1 Tax=Liquorilactobacillus aquaticus DSM 21051 TaxID=1423725 RepID=A0A0R2CTE4_9LACO|nr:BglG family transcription antiterminator [Liquorilactobacillus aquaticus]KRM95048.1 licABCH operon regulator [Liquorilactobacillus aquaticus DSM 21051]
MESQQNLDAKDQKILSLILQQEIVHYQDISQKTGYSKKTISNHLNHIEDFLEEYEVRLTRKRGVGIQIKGDTKKINSVRKMYFGDDEVTLSLLSKLTFSDHPLKIQDLADVYFLSRTAIEMKLQKIKPILDQYEIELETKGHEGLKITGTSKQKRKFAADLLYKFWNTQSDELVFAEKILSNIIDKNLFERILRVTDEFIGESHLNFTDYGKESLVIHLAISLSRISEKKEVQNKIKGKEVCEETLFLINKLENEFQIKIPNTEANYLDIHIQSVKADKNKSINTSSNPGLSELLMKNIDKYDQSLLNGLVLHLTPAIKRTALGLSIRNPLKDEVKKNFVRAYEEALKLSDLVSEKYNVKFDEHEASYIALHFQAYFERKKATFSIYLVCSSGMGTAQLLKQRILQNFSSQIEVLEVLSNNEYQNISERELKKADLVISTINISERSIPVIVINPFLDVRAIDEIKHGLNRLSNQNKVFNIHDLIRDENVIVIDQKISFEDTVSIVSKKAIKMKLAKKGIAEAILARENLSSTFYEEVGLPHANKEYVKKSSLFIFVSQQGISKEYEKVKVLFFLLLTDDIKPYLDDFYELLNEIVTDKRKINKIIRAKNSEEVLKEIETR